MQTFQGNVADTQIVQDYAEAASGAIRRGVVTATFGQRSSFGAEFSLADSCDGVWMFGNFRRSRSRSFRRKHRSIELE